MQEQLPGGPVWGVYLDPERIGRRADRLFAVAEIAEAAGDAENAELLEEKAIEAAEKYGTLVAARDRALAAAAAN